MTNRSAGTTPPFLPGRLDGSLRDIVEQLRRALDTVDNLWMALLDASQRVANPEPDDWSHFHTAGIIRDPNTIEWSRAGLTEHFSRMILPTDAGLDELIEDTPFVLDDAVENALVLQRTYPAEMTTLMSGQIGTAVKAILGENANEAESLEPILMVHALECLQFAALDARTRIDRPTGILSLDQVKDRAPTMGPVRKQIEHDVSLVPTYRKIRARSPVKATDEDSRRLAQMLPSGLPEQMEKHYRAVHGQQLPAIASQLIAQGIKLLPDIERGLAQLKKQTGKSRDTVESFFEIDALPIFHCVATSIASLITVDGRFGLGMRQVIDQIAGCKPINWSLSSVSDNDCVHALFLAHRIAVIQDRHTPPPSFIKYAAQQRLLDAPSIAWSPPFNYAQVSEVMKEIERDRPLRDAHFEVEGRKVRRAVTANSRDPENARRLLEMRSRFWFRLHL